MRKGEEEGGWKKEEEQGGGGKKRRRKAISESLENALYFYACFVLLESAGDEECRRKSRERTRERQRARGTSVAGVQWRVLIRVSISSALEG